MCRLDSTDARVYLAPFRAIWNIAWLVLTFTCLLWGANAIASKLAIGHVSPMSLVFLRWTAVCFALAVVLRRQIWAHREALRARRAWILAAGAAGFTGFTVLFYIAAYFTSAVNMTLLQAVIPAFVLGGAAMFKGARITPMQIFGMIVTLVGVVVIAMRGDPAHILDLSFNFGDLLLIAACALYAAYTVALRDRPAMPPLVLFTALAFAAFLTSAPALAMEMALGKFYWPTPFGWAVLAFVAVGPSLLSQLMFMRGVELIGPARAGVFTNLTPIFGSLLAVLVLGEPFHLYHAIALALSLAGIYIAERGAKQM